MENLLTLVFEAHNPVRNHHRRYSIHVGRDLFGDWTIAFEFGRCGRRGQEVRFSERDNESLDRRIGECLRRRLFAPKRIGCRYELKTVEAIDESVMSHCVPAKLMTEFLPLADQRSRLQIEHQFK